ncbi:MAG TPA: hypothetical protein VGY91_14825 [Chthoniobacterales bacterium]|nr:hypothetical protein [Chthoniobacterales bacterium]
MRHKNKLQVTELCGLDRRWHQPLMIDVAVRILLPEMVGKVGIDNQAKAVAYDGKTGLPQPVQ